MEQYYPPIFSYHLPEEKIAQRPMAYNGNRSAAKFLVAKEPIESTVVSDLPKYLRAGDLVVLNDTKVLPSRFFLEDGTEVFFVLDQPIDHEHVLLLGKPIKKIEQTEVLSLTPTLSLKILNRHSTQYGTGLLAKIQSSEIPPMVALRNFLFRNGSIPIPPYIRGGKSDQKDFENYQTVYSNEYGSVAAPTAGLHITQELLEEMRKIGVIIAYVTLRVGLASVLSVERQLQETSDLSTFTERYQIPETTLQALLEAKERGNRVVAVGTTSTRALESWASKHYQPVEKEPRWVQTDLFIRPGYEWKVVDVLITNLHQPHSTHLLLVAAFAGWKKIEEVYTYALEKKYRFLSYGDSSLLFRSSAV